MERYNYVSKESYIRNTLSEDYKISSKMAKEPKINVENLIEKLKLRRDVCLRAAKRCNDKIVEIENGKANSSRTR